MSLLRVPLQHEKNERNNKPSQTLTMPRICPFALKLFSPISTNLFI